MISAVIITYNEAKHIAATINSCKDVVDEVIVVDAESTDDTILIAQQADQKVKTFVKYWEGYGAARNHGAAKAKHDWILSIDADERCSQALLESIKKVQLEKTVAFQVRRENIYKSEIIKYGFLAPEWKTRLYHKLVASWGDEIVHESLQPKQGKLEYRQLNGGLMHHAYESQAHHREKLDQYAKLSVQSKNRKPLDLLADKLAPTYHFVRAHFLKLGCLQSPYGMETSKNAYYYSKRKRFYLNSSKG